MSDNKPKKDNIWALVEVMGHRRFAGQITEEVVAGAGFLRVDVPQVADRMAFTKLIGTGSIYCITPVSEAVARQLAEKYHEKPVEVYSPSVQPRLGFRGEDEDDDRGY